MAFTLRGVDATVANALRRAALADVPNVAVLRADVSVSHNTSVLHDEFLAERVSMLPLKLHATEIDAYVPASVTLHLDVTNSGKHPLDVTSKDVRVRLHGTPHPRERQILPPCCVTGDFVLLTRLQVGQRLALTATARKDTPATHAAFACTSLLSYALAPDVHAIATARRALNPHDAHALNRFDHTDSKRLYERNESGAPAAFQFVVESESGLSEPEVVQRAFAALQAKFRRPKFTVRPLQGDPLHLQYTVSAEGHTFGSVLQSAIVDHADALGILSAGYFEPHPLDPHIALKVRFAEPPDMAASAFEDMCATAHDRVLEAARAFDSALEAHARPK
jgi:DNA-directed RNA polymerase subunit L